ncbi:MAG: ribonuclease HII [Defluviitaleaceae bacterium]|nr:ribonuclease HII [Defluviitaleaceae bacterium]
MKDLIFTQKIFDFDLSLNCKHICGVDEAGRGPLAGPVVCASVIMPYDSMIDGIYDSKGVSEKKRSELFDKIKNVAISYHIAVIDCDVIDEINILEATKQGMVEAIVSVCDVITPDKILVDAVKGLNIDREYVALIKGDQTSYAIASASILAKVTRDRLMEEYDKQYLQYGFNKHRGYGTVQHIGAIKEFGLCPIHRKSFCKNFI